jgi:hypothetical protein
MAVVHSLRTVVDIVSCHNEFVQGGREIERTVVIYEAQEFLDMFLSPRG